MPTAEYFNRYPAFPKDVPVMDLPRISLASLVADDDPESAQLFRACKETGFFLLDLRCTGEGETMLKVAEATFDLSEKVFDTDQAELMKHAFTIPGGIFGYKNVGTTKVDDGTPDSIEFYVLSQDDLLGIAQRDNPEIFQANRKIPQDFFHHAHGIMSHLLSHLDKHLALKPNTIASLCPQDKPSNSALRLLKAHPQNVPSHRVSLIGHTDTSTMTMVFNVVGGLQILPAGAENVEANWHYVRPEPGCAIINLGDVLVQWSGGILRSNLHRVATPPGEQASCERYSLAYFLRPGNHVSMRRLESRGVIPQPAEGEENEDMSLEAWGWRITAKKYLGKAY